MFDFFNINFDHRSYFKRFRIFYFNYNIVYYIIHFKYIFDFFHILNRISVEVCGLEKTRVNSDILESVVFHLTLKNLGLFVSVLSLRR
jgi:hypothetical protein